MTAAFTPAGRGQATRAAHDWHDTAPWVRFGTRVIMVATAAFVSAAMLVPGGNAVVLSATVSFEGSPVAVASGNGGVVTHVAVTAGANVKAGDALITLEAPSKPALLNGAAAKATELAVQEARLLAESVGRDRFSAPDGIDMAEPANVARYEAELALLAERSAAHTSALNAARAEIAEIDGAIQRASAALQAREKELLTNELDLSNARPLFDRGTVSVNPVGPLQRENVRIRSDILQFKAEIAKLKDTRPAAEQRVMALKQNHGEQIAVELERVQEELSTHSQLLAAAKAQPATIVLHAPSDGVVVGTVPAAGNRLAPSIAVLEIVPYDSRIVAEVHLPPSADARLHAGEPVQLRMADGSASDRSDLMGVVDSITPQDHAGADTAPTALARIEVPLSELQKLAAGKPWGTVAAATVHLEGSSGGAVPSLFRPLFKATAQARIAEPPAPAQ